MALERAATAIGLGVGLLALLLRLTLSFIDGAAAGSPPAWTLIGYLSYYTILTNLMLVLIYAAHLSKAAWLNWFRAPATRTMMAGVIILVMVFYHVLLSGLWSPQGLHKVADVLLHYATPVFYVLWWWIFDEHGAVRMRDIPKMLVPSLAYVIYTLGRGAMIGTYPYPIFEVGRLGYPQVLVNIAVVAIALVVLFAIFIFADRYLARSTPLRTTE
jgi:hypothetical protein